MKGFTLFETIISLTIIGVVLSLSFPVYKNFQEENNLLVGRNTLVHALRRAQILARASKGDSSWGTYINSGKVIVFQGSNYLNRDVSFDEVFSIPSNITTSGLSEIIFSNFSGFPDITGVITLFVGEKKQEITINEKGTVDY